MFSNQIVCFSDVHYSDKHLPLISPAMTKFKSDCASINPKFIIFCGDLFHTRVSSDDLCYRTAIADILHLSSLCEKLYIVKGTYSHDFDTLKIFDILSSIKPNIKYIPTAQSVVDCGISFLFLPEEYPADPELFYSNFLSTKYDYVFGHGDIQGAMLHSGIHNSLLKGFKWSPSLLSEISRFSVFGHIHKHQFINRNVLYCGSFSRTGYGEEEDKGYIKIDINLNTCEFFALPSEKFLTIKIESEEDFLTASKDQDIQSNIRFSLPQELGHLRQEIKSLFDNGKICFESIQVDQDENVLLYENISNLSIQEQFVMVLNSDITNKKITLKEQKFFNSQNVEKMIFELIDEIATSK